jgi:hypothetical protein
VLVVVGVVEKIQPQEQCVAQVEVEAVAAL